MIIKKHERVQTRAQEMMDIKFRQEKQKKPTNGMILFLLYSGFKSGAEQDFEVGYYFNWQNQCFAIR